MIAESLRAIAPQSFRDHDALLFSGSVSNF